MVEDAVRDELVSRTHVLARWDVSLSTLLRATDLTRVRSKSTRQAMYRRADVEAFAKRRGLSRRSTGGSLSGETIASIFDDLDAGVTPAAIVRRTRLHPDVVEAVVERWHRMHKVVVAMNQEEVQQLLAAVGITAQGPVRGAGRLIEIVRGAERGVVEGASPAVDIPHPGIAASEERALDDASRVERRGDRG